MTEAGGTPTPARGPEIVGVVPACGASTRMGRPKGMLELQGRTFMRRAVEALRRGGCSSVLVVTRVADHPLQAEATSAGARILENPEPGSGPITSLRLALGNVPDTATHVVWLPLDHPMVSAETVRAVISSSRSGDPAVTLPVHDGRRGHPAVFARRIFGALLDPELEGGARTVVHRCLDDGTARLVQTDDPGVLVDVDTPAEYRALAPRRAGP